MSDTNQISVVWTSAMNQTKADPVEAIYLLLDAAAFIVANGEGATLNDLTARLTESHVTFAAAKEAVNLGVKRPC